MRAINELGSNGYGRYQIYVSIPVLPLQVGMTEGFEYRTRCRPSQAQSQAFFPRELSSKVG